jgi:hypothetical protein
MSPSAKKPPPPSDADITAALGPARSLWDDLRHQVRRDFAPLTEDWVFSGAKHGWALRLKRGNRAVLYLKPLERSFRVSLALGPRAVEGARRSKLSAPILRLIDEAVQYPEGKAVRLEIRSPRDIRVALQLVGIKLDV